MGVRRVQWLACIACSAIPALLFLSVLVLMPAGDEKLRTVASALANSPDSLLTFAKSKLAILTFRYNSYAFGHILLSGLVSIFFLAVARKHSSSARSVLSSEVIFLCVAALLASLLFVAATFNWGGLFGGFGNRVIDPFLLFYEGLKLGDEFSRFGYSAETFLSLAVLIPTLFGVICVVIASGAFHLAILQRKRPGEPGWQEDFQKNIAMAKLHLTVLSLLLVSSTLTARFYFYMVPELLSEQAGEARQIYLDLANALSSGGGLLFTLTLIATFAPGIALLLLDLFDLKYEGEDSALPALLDKLNLADWSAKLTTLLRGLITIAAPVLAGPFMDAFAAILK